MRPLMAILGTMAAGLLALFWLIGWVLLRGDQGLQGSLHPFPPLGLAAVAGAALALHLVQLGAVLLRRGVWRGLRAGLVLAGVIAATAGVAISLADPLTADFWLLCLISAILNFLCAAMPAPKPKDNA